MRGIDYSVLSTDELIQKFVENAKAAGCVYGLLSLPNEKWGQALQRLQNTSNEAKVRDMQSLGAELRKRKPIAELRTLFDDRDADVRGWAGAQFLSIDPEWAAATMTGLAQNLSTQEVLGWRDRVLKDPPTRPTVGEMMVSQLVARFIENCGRCYGSTRFISEEEGGWPTMRAYNKISGEVCAVADELNRRGQLGALVPLLDHPLVTVRQGRPILPSGRHREGHGRFARDRHKRPVAGEPRGVLDA